MRELLDEVLSLSGAWAMEEVRLRAHNASIFVRLRADPRALTDAERSAATRKLEFAPAERYRRAGGVAVIPVRGVIRRFVVDDLRAAIAEAGADDEVHTLLFDVDSPGGSVSGVPEIAQEMKQLARDKRVVAYVDGLMASGAYWICSQCDEIYASIGASIGSIGVYQVLDDWERFFKEYGVDTHIIRSGRQKGVGVPGARIESDQLEAIGEEVEAYNDLFVSAVATGRGLSIETAKGLADGKLHVGAAALDKGLVDGIATRDELLQQLDASASDEGKGKAMGKPSTPSTTVGESVVDPKSESPAQPDQKMAAIETNGPSVGDPVAQERNRATQIMELADAGQESIALELVKSGKSVADAAVDLARDRRAKAAAEAAKSAASAMTVQGNHFHAPADPRADARARILDAGTTLHETGMSVASMESDPDIKSVGARTDAREEAIRQQCAKEWLATPIEERQCREFKTFFFAELGDMRSGRRAARTKGA